MRVLVAILVIVLSLPWFVAFWVFRQNFPPRQRLGVGALGAAFGACLVIAAGSVFIPSWYASARGALMVLAVLYGVAFGAEARKRRRARRAGTASRAG